jgi:hypothetical protein
MQLASGSGRLPRSGSNTADGAIDFWHATTGMNQLTRQIDAPVRSMAFSPDGKTLAVSSIGGLGVRVRRLDAATGTALSPLEGAMGLGNTPWRLAFSPGGEWIAGGPMWDAHTGKQIHPSERGATPSHAFTPDGSRLFTSFNDGTLSIWRTDTGERILRLYLDKQWDLQFAPDGRRLYVYEFGYGIGVGIFDTKPAIPPEADELLGSLRKRFPLYCEMREFLRTDGQIDASLRDTVLSMSDGIAEDSNAVSDLVRKPLISFGAAASVYQQALRRSRLIADARPWDQSGLFWLGVAQYRTGDYSGAIATLERFPQQQGRFGPPSGLVIALAHQHLGHAARAKELLDMARPSAAKATNNDDVSVFLRALLPEAESLIGPQK